MLREEKCMYRQEMQRIIGKNNLSHKDVKDYLPGGWWNRELLPWEHVGMSFQKMYIPMRRDVTDAIYLCNYNGESFYFGIGLDEPEITDDMLKNGTWSVYTWSD